MDEIIQILIFAGAMIFSVVVQYAKNKKKPETTSPKEVLEDIFPEIKDFEEEMPEDVQPVQKPVTPLPKKPVRVKKSPEVVKPTPSPVSKPKESKRIRLDDRKEAKRAFIYSEIFNRKY